MATKPSEYTVPMPRESWLDGIAESKAEGQIAGQIDAIMTVLEARCRCIPMRVRRRIRECTNLDQLHQYARRAAVVESTDDLFGLFDD